MGSKTLAYVRYPDKKWKVLNAFRCEETASICASNLAEELGQSLLTLAIVQPFEEKFATQVFYVDEDQDISLVKQFYVKDETELEVKLEDIPEPLFSANKGLVYPEGLNVAPSTSFRQTQQELDDLIFRPVTTPLPKTPVIPVATLTNPKPKATAAPVTKAVTVTPIVAKPLASVKPIPKPAAPKTPVATAAPSIAKLPIQAMSDLDQIATELRAKLNKKLEYIASYFQKDIMSLIESDIKNFTQQYSKIFNDDLKILPTNVIQILKQSINDVTMVGLKEINQPLEDVALDNKSEKEIKVYKYCDIMILYVLSVILPPDVYMEPLTVWRWEDRDTARKNEEVISWPLFTSTSLSKEVALKKADTGYLNGYLLEITIPVQSSFLYTDGLPGAYEILLPPCTKTIVTSDPIGNTNGYKTVKAKVLPYKEATPGFLSNLNKIRRLMVLKHYSTLFQPFEPSQLNYWSVNMTEDLKRLKCTDTKTTTPKTAIPVDEEGKIVQLLKQKRDQNIEKDVKDFFKTKVNQLIDEDIKTIKNQEPKTFNETKLKITPTNLVELIKRSISTARGDRLYEMNNLLKEVAIRKESKKDINIDIFCDIMILRFFSVYKKGEVYPSDLTVWRWVDGKTNLDYKQSGNLISWPFFTITSLSEKKELKSVSNQKSGYLLKITIPKGSAFLYSEDWPSYKDVLLPPCTKIELGKVSSPLDGKIGFTAARVLPYPEKFPDIEKFARILVLKHYYSNSLMQITPALMEQWDIDMVKDLQLLACTPAPANPEVKKNF